MQRLHTGITVVTLLLTQVTSNLVSTYYQNSHSKVNRNKFLAAHAACSQKHLTVVVKFREPFYGIVYSGESPVKCQALGNGTTELWMDLDLKECAIKSVEENGKRVLENFLYIQYDRQVQQAADEQVLVRCSQDIVLTGSLGATSSPQQFTKSSPPQARSETQALTSSSGNMVDAWMEFMKGKLPLLKKVNTYVNVGEEVTMLIKIRQKPGLEAKVTGCIAHDGVSTLHQRLTDDNGCSVNKKVMGDLVEKVNSRNGIKAVHATFTAFRFPDKTKLYLECQILICNFTCPLMTCRKTSAYPTTRIKRSTYASIRNNRNAQILDEIEVSNSIEVRKAASDKMQAKRKSKEKTFLSALDENDNFFCLNTTRLLLVGLSLLSLMTMLMVITICMCVRSRKLQRRLHRRMDVGFPYGRVIDYT